MAKREQLDLLIANVEKTIAMTEGRITMQDKEKFEGFKQRLIDENEQKYGREIREKYGDDVVDQSNAKLKGMSQEDYEKVTRLEAEVAETLRAALQTGDPPGSWPKRPPICTLSGCVAFGPATARKPTWEWPRCTWTTNGFLRDAVFVYTGMDK